MTKTVYPMSNYQMMIILMMMIQVPAVALLIMKRSFIILRWRGVMLEGRLHRRHPLCPIGIWPGRRMRIRSIRRRLLEI
uniref:Putative secreted protein n=1 Tax=Xenopsylla cheopis TaxID=163159 RepID=A0A6M2E1Y9_XENCH